MNRIKRPYGGKCSKSMLDGFMIGPVRWGCNGNRSRLVVTVHFPGPSVFITAYSERFTSIEFDVIPFTVLFLHRVLKRIYDAANLAWLQRDVSGWPVLPQGLLKRYPIASCNRLNVCNCAKSQSWRPSNKASKSSIESIASNGTNRSSCIQWIASHRAVFHHFPMLSCD